MRLRLPKTIILCAIGFVDKHTMSEQNPKKKPYLTLPASSPPEPKVEEAELNVVKDSKRKMKLVVCMKEEKVKNVDSEKKQLLCEEYKSIVEGKEVILMPLTGKHGLGKYAKLYKEDYEKVKHIKWYISGNYPRSNLGYLHKYILGFKVGDKQQVDHIDHDVFNCCLDNLRIVTINENTFNRRKASSNTSGITGVVFRSDTEKWRASISKDGIRINLGTFDNREDAISARTKAEIKYYGYNIDNQTEIKIQRLENYVKDGVGYIGLCGRDGIGKYSLVSMEDFERCTRLKWSFHKGYVYNTSYGFIHRYILEPSGEFVVDHKNGNLLDNRRDNLRICSHRDNVINSKRTNNSGHRGVTISKDGRKNKYRAYIKYGDKWERFNFSSLEEAISWRKAKEKELFGEENVKILEERGL